VASCRREFFSKFGKGKAAHCSGRNQSSVGTVRFTSGQKDLKEPEVAMPE
jgi:hypothetical protein